MNKLKAFICVSLLLLASVSVINAANKKPYPQAESFSGCIKPDAGQSAMNASVKAYYESWRDAYLKESSKTDKGYYIKSGGNRAIMTISEVTGYGMIIFPLMAGADDNAQKYFDGLHYFAKDHPSSENKSLMSWEIEDGEVGKESSATDGDIDMVYGYILAHDQWGSDGDINYIVEARKMIYGGVSKSNINPDIMRITLGDFVDNDDPNAEFYWGTRPSDWMGDHFRLFSYCINGSKLLDDIADGIYPLYEKFTAAHSSSTGLVSDFIVKDPPEPAPENYMGEFKHTDQYCYNACRVPWRIAVDYAHYKTSGAKSMVNKMVDWVKDKTNDNPAVIAAGYNIETGNALNSATGDMAYTAPFIAGCIVDSKHQSYLNDGWDEIKSDHGGGVYHRSINLLSQLLISGNWWKPKGDTIPPDTSGVILDNFKNQYGDGNTQTYLGAAWGYAITQDWNKADTGGAFWYVYCDDSGSTLESEGFVINNSNGKDMVYPKKEDGYLHLEMKTSKSTIKYSYAGLGCQILGIKEGVYYDFSSMTGMTIRAKGSGALRIALLTKDIFELKEKEDRWGYYGVTIPKLEDKWKTYSFTTDLFLPEKYSHAAKEEWTWDHEGAKDKVIQIEIATSEAGKDVDLYIDFIMYNGMSYTDFFSEKYISPEIVTIQGIIEMKNGSPVKVMANSKTVTVSYSLLKSGNVDIAIYNLQGQKISEPLKFTHTAGTYKQTINFNKTNTSGVYFVSFSVGDNVYYNKFNIVK